MKRVMFTFAASMCMLAIGVAQPACATTYVHFQDDFETSWTGDYADGWINAAYRHGDPPVGQMMQQTTQAHTGDYGLKLIADSTPESWMWWAAVEVESLPHWMLAREYDPYVSVWYYDELSTTEDPRAGQVYAVPDWQVDEDWTDVQFGGRFNVTDNYYHVTADLYGSGGGWQNTGVARTNDWHELTFQLSSTDGYIHFSLDGTEVGTSTRNDYTNLGTAIGLYTMFEDPLSWWTGEEGPGYKPYTLWDDFEVGSQVPEPMSMVMLGALGAGMLAARKARRKR